MLSKLSRHQLDAQARRIGIERPEQYGAAELIALMLGRSAEEAERSLRNVPGSRTAKVASGLLSALSQSGLLQRFARPALHEPKVAPTPASVSNAPASWRGQVAAAAAPSAPVSSPAPVAPVTPDPVPVAPTVVAEVERMVVAPTTSEAAEVAQPAEPAFTPDGVPTQRFTEEPIRTRSMARVLALQGHRDRAVSILESILSAHPEDRAAREDLERLRSDLPLEGGQALPEPRPLPTLPDTGDRIELTALPSRMLHIAWSTTEAGKARAQAVLGSEGELALRVVAITPDPTRVVRSDITERGPVDAVHEWLAPAIEPGSRCFAAIGLRAGDRFVAIAHAPARTIH
jgi:hypothetical protein